MSTHKIPELMRAWTYAQPGLPKKVLTLSDYLPVPRIKTDTDILVRVAYAALNPGGSIAMQLFPSFLHQTKRPWIPEMDFSGTIVAAGTKVNTLRPELTVGSRIFGALSFTETLGLGQGSLAEYLVVDCRHVARMPGKERLAEVAGLGVAGTTAVILVQAAKLKPGDNVLFIGGNGGIGSIALQIVRRLVGNTGKITVVCNGHYEGAMKGFGADEVIDRREQDQITKYLAVRYHDRNFDAVVDSVGLSDVYFASGQFLKPSGIYASVGARMSSYSTFAMLWSVVQMARIQLTPRILGGGSRQYVQVANMEPSGEHMKLLAHYIEDDAEYEFEGVVDSVHEMEDVQRAYEKALNHSTLGKVVVKVSKIHEDSDSD